jgi:serine/threonine protein kinase
VRHDTSFSNTAHCHAGKQKADIWSCGVILYAMLYGCYPFSNKEPDYIRKIVTATYHMPPDVQVPKLSRLFMCCLCLRPFQESRSCPVASRVPSSAKRLQQCPVTFRVTLWHSSTRSHCPAPGCTQVSAECKDLLTRLLVADSEQRLSMEDIKNHSWFTHALPSGAIQMNDWYMREANGINEVQAPHSKRVHRAVCSAQGATAASECSNTC